MKLFLERLLTFALPIFAIVLLLEYSVRRLPNSYKVKGQYLNEKSDIVETLILGSSHTFYGVNPRFIESRAFNASNVSQSPDIDFAILKSYEDSYGSLRTVVIRLSYDTLFEQLKNSTEDWRLKDYKLYSDIDAGYKLSHNSEILSIGTRQILKVLGDFYLNQKPLLNCDSLGWGNDLSNRPKRDLDKVGLIAAKRHTIKSWTLLKPNIKVFEQLIGWCENRKIRVILVTPPAYKSYVKNLNEKQLEKMINIGDKLDKTYDNCFYHNFLMDKSFTDKDFYDADHLNAKGAKKFSLIINSLIEN